MGLQRMVLNNGCYLLSRVELQQEELLKGYFEVLVLYS